MNNFHDPYRSFSLNYKELNIVLQKRNELEYFLLKSVINDKDKMIQEI